MPKKNALFPIAYDEISLVDEGAAGSADVLIMKRNGIAKGRTQSNPCSTASNSSGKKDGKSTRSKNWDENKHPCDEKGKMKQSSSESKKQNGKGGTTKAKLDAKCKEKKRKGVKPARQTTRDPEGRRKIRRRRAEKSVEKTAMSTWDSDAQVRALMERK
jgi:hypothetical protein